MTNEQHDAQESDFPREIGRPARSALIEAGYWQLEQLTRISETEVMKLHGFGPKALKVLRSALATKGLSFASTK